MGVLDELKASSICLTGCLKGGKGKESWLRRAFGLILPGHVDLEGLAKLRDRVVALVPWCLRLEHGWTWTISMDI